MLRQLAMRLQIFLSRKRNVASGTENTPLTSFLMASQITMKTKQC